MPKVFPEKWFFSSVETKLFCNHFLDNLYGILMQWVIAAETMADYVWVKARFSNCTISIKCLT